MDKTNFGFEIPSPNVLSLSYGDLFFKTRKLKNMFGEKSFETSWQFIETLS